jgi:HAD superfamily hydrolase (TIGR01459 family)
VRDISQTSLDRLIEAYDVFFVDQFGVLRDDEGAYPGAVEALQRLKAADKTVVILSNSGRSGDYNASRFVSLGFRRDNFDHFVTSGDAAYAVLSRQGSPVSAGARCVTISSGGDRNLAERLGMRHVETFAEADFLIISGSEAERISMDTYADMLRPAAARNVPAICTNPDIHKLVQGTIAPGAGSIAQLYERLGGMVRWFGKPHRDIYEEALRLCGPPPLDQVICVGDSIDHDILGAKKMGLHSVLVRTGILADLPASQIEEMMIKDRQPTFLMEHFR